MQGISCAMLPAGGERSRLKRYHSGAGAGIGRTALPILTSLYVTASWRVLWIISTGYWNLSGGAWPGVSWCFSPVRRCHH